MLAFVHIPKTAGETIIGILRRNFSFRHLDSRLIEDNKPITAAQVKRALAIYPRIESIAGHAVCAYSDLSSEFPRIRFYTFLREPNGRFASNFLFSNSVRILHRGWRPETNKELEDTFPVFLESKRDVCCRVLALGGESAAAIGALETQFGFVGLVEHFDESLALIRNWMGRPNFDLRYQRKNASKGRSRTKPKSMAVHLDRLDKWTREFMVRPNIVEMIAEANQADIVLYEYARDKIFERMRNDYSAGSGPFNFEDETMAQDAILGRIYRNLVGRPFVRLVVQ